MVYFRLTSLTPNVGAPAVDLPATGVTCIVGGNNAGKSQLLRDIYQYLEAPDSARLVALGDIEADKRDDGDADIEKWLLENAAVQKVQPGEAPVFNAFNGFTATSQLRAYDFRMLFRMDQGAGLRATTPFLCSHATAGSLVNYAAGSVPQGIMSGSGHPLSQLLRYGELEEELSSLALSVFGQPLVLDRLNMSVQLRVGDPGIPVPPLNRPTREYADAVEALPALEFQGDGMKAFIGLALSVIAGSTQVLLVDEPEAFLHPAQARALGRWIAREAKKRGKQVILATHDRDLVLGLLDGDDSVKMLRVSRNGNASDLRELAGDRLAEVWSDPVLRYSNVLQGLFHERVVICESDADCRFYSAVLDSMSPSGMARMRADGTLFVPSGGKQRVAVLARALSGLGVEVAAFPDFDVLRDKRDVQGILEALGGTWTDEIDAKYLIVVRSVPNAAAWDNLKHQGLGGLPGGAPYSAGVELLSMLGDSGLRIVPVGEMEDFDKTSGFHGSAWVSEMLERKAHETCAAAHSFVGSLLASA